MSIEVNPYTAFVTWPVEVASVSGSAKNARSHGPCPSRRSSRGFRPGVPAALAAAPAAVISEVSVPTDRIVGSGHDGPARDHLAPRIPRGHLRDGRGGDPDRPGPARPVDG